MLLDEAFSSEGGADFSMSDDWMGMSTRPDGALVAPGLLQSVSRKQAEKNAIAKERRKAAEERRLRSRHGGGDDGPPGPHKDKPAKGPGKGKAKADADK